MKNKMNWLEMFVMLLVLGMMFASCELDENDQKKQREYGEQGGQNQNHVWLLSKETIYSVFDGIAGSVSMEINMNWISNTYINNNEYECEYSIITPPIYNVEETAYAITTTKGSNEHIAHQVRNGQTVITSARTISDSLIIVSYIANIPDFTQHTLVESEFISTFIYDLASGLMLSSTRVGSNTMTLITNNGEPTIIVTPINYEFFFNIELLTEVNGVRVYRHRQTDTNVGTYSEVKIQNGVTLETKFNMNGVLSYITTNTFPNNAIIRTKVPTFTLSHMEVPSSPDNNSYSTAEVLFDSTTILIIREKRFSVLLFP
jgi:hypothetical protein